MKFILTTALLFSSSLFASNCFKTQNINSLETEIISYLCDTKSGIIKIPSIINGHTVVKIGDHVFDHLSHIPPRHNTVVTELHLPNTIQVIGDYAFASNEIDSLVLPESVSHIGAHAFDSNSISDLKLSSNIKKMGIASFRFNKLKRVFIPARTKLGPSAFLGNQLEYVHFEQGYNQTFPGNFGHGVFGSNAIKHVVLPSSFTELYASFFLNNPLKSVVVIGNLSIKPSFGAIFTDRSSAGKFADFYQSSKSKGIYIFDDLTNSWSLLK